ncbi:MAG: hypothetical protein FWD25_04225 [Clostridia bacterium]|nr:hypothetical protein [Clostridia bacterium]
MIRVYCDVCGAEIAEIRSEKYLPESDDENRKSDPTQSWHKCAKCAEILRMIDVPNLVKEAVVAMRADIPKAEKGSDRQKAVRFVP